MSGRGTPGAQERLGTRSHRLAVLLRQPCGPLQRQALQGVKVEPLVQGQELPGDGLGRMGPVSSVASGFPLYPTPALLPSPVSPGRQQVPSRGHQTPPDNSVEHDQRDPRDRYPCPIHLQRLLGCQGPDDGGHGAQVPRAHGGEGSHDFLVQGTLLCPQAPRQLQHPLGIHLQAEG